MQRARFLEGSKIYLSPFEEDDLEIYFHGNNSEAVRETLFLFSPVTKEEMKAEIEKWITESTTKLFTICDKGSDKAVGTTALFRIDYMSRAAVFFIAIYDQNSWSKGFGSEATELMLKYSFDILNLNRIQLHVAVENEKGVKAYRRNGFEIEGKLRQAMYHNNKYVDFYVMGILRDEYYDQGKVREQGGRKNSG